jgi:hypothetical protein
MEIALHLLISSQIWRMDSKPGVKFLAVKENHRSTFPSSGAGRNVTCVGTSPLTDIGQRSPQKTGSGMGSASEPLGARHRMRAVASMREGCCRGRGVLDRPPGARGAGRVMSAVADLGSVTAKNHMGIVAPIGTSPILENNPGSIQHRCLDFKRIRLPYR